MAVAGIKLIKGTRNVRNLGFLVHTLKPKRNLLLAESRKNENVLGFDNSWSHRFTNFHHALLLKFVRRNYAHHIDRCGSSLCLH